MAYIDENFAYDLSLFEEPEELEGMTRAEVVEWVKDHLDDLDQFAERGGNVYCYVSELDYHMKPTALLYRHPEFGFLWLEDLVR